METLQVRVYNVLFGDAILISIPDQNPNGEIETRHVLIDVGNVLSKTKGGLDDVFKPVIKNILEVLDGQPLDLYIMTHEHLDHVQGLPYGEEKIYLGSDDELRQKLQTRHAWLTASAREGYYEDHPDAKKRKLELMRIYAEIDSYIRVRSASREPILEAIKALWMNNNPRKTADCVKYLRSIGENTSYVYRGFDSLNQSPFHEAKIEIWAPEENTAEYYGRFRPAFRALGVTRLSEGGRGKQSVIEPIPPQGVDAGAFYNLVNSRKEIFESLLAIDKAANNTSVVFSLEWRGYRLLFTGDAEERSWKTMDKYGVLKPVHFLKVSHHGSHNGTPEPELLDKILPLERPDEKPRYAIVATWKGTYQNVPDEETLSLICDRCDKLYYAQKENGEMRNLGDYVDIKFEAEGQEVPS
ncbi:MAG: hypothetical protein JSW14_00115 [Candidatus Bathyarchaeum sp.]|nr:MAG: hypothetical protein JSW14_00115 [Candidatus Bathyarchaeum sp.]